MRAKCRPSYPTSECPWQPCPPPEEEIKTARTDLARAEAELSVNERSLEQLDLEHLTSLDNIRHIQEQLDSAPEEFIDIKIEQRQEEVARQLGFELTDHHLNMYGLCPDCLGS